jgi:hypothetical protein
MCLQLFYGRRQNQIPDHFVWMLSDLKVKHLSNDLHSMPDDVIQFNKVTLRGVAALLSVDSDVTMKKNRSRHYRLLQTKQGDQTLGPN